jgi:hypothetical protein
LAPLAVAANGEPSPKNKLTFSYYAFSSQRAGVDVNLRHSFKSSTAWIAGYHENTGFDQERAGFEYDYQGSWLKLVPSVQVATHGFLGATVYSEMGHSFYAIAGAGRTNLRPYWNLGFDPNDYVQAGAGFHGKGDSVVAVYAIHDVRLDTGQTNTHFYYRQPLPHEWRLTFDVVNEHGNGDGGLVVHSWAPSVAIDWRRWFAKIAEDPHVNYTADHQVRVGVGIRF